MRHIDGLYTQQFNRFYKRTDPLSQGRYKAILIDADESLAAAVRYIHLNPVEVEMVQGESIESNSLQRLTTVLSFKYSIFIFELTTRIFPLTDNPISLYDKDGFHQYRFIHGKP